ncbi:amino acid adenylation domain-containing protein [Archangium violaceum]|uniref:amino acid adenylation domain-containing protein n=1 Tax=Archangium violaceum TaxID=83451 RepID=UPI002B29528B|nr:amino acid adenylation domain-containing protein [Archangium gephyra]
MSDDAVSEQFETIAIVGMTGRFPGARDLETFWRNLCEGVEARASFSDEELEAAGVDPALRARPGYVRAGFPLESPEFFDAGFFGFNPREAELLDPQHRLFLECAWEALERAGYDAERHRGSIAVFASSSISSYLLYNLMSQPDVVRSAGPYALLLANDKDFLATRVSHKLNLRGPSINVQTACSSSLVAVHLACQSLLSGESDMAMAGGVSIGFPQRAGYMFQEGSILSPDGHCRAFDAQGQGTVAGSGVGIVVLKRMSDALKDGDFIHAVIRGSALNNDGSGKVGYTAPSVDGQAAAISEALAVANVSASSIQYIEAHGTGTRLGDPIEIAGLTQAFKDQDAGPASCAIGSVKTNIGHLDAAAGVTGLIKAALALQHRQMPPSLHFREPNPGLGLERSPFYVNTALREWPASEEPRRAGVSSFGIGGTNAHAILEEAPQVARTPSARPWQLLVLSARSANALEQATGQLAEHLTRHPELELADVAFTLQAGRQRFTHRRAVVCRGLEDARAVLSGQHPQRLLTQVQEATERPVTFLFPGQGSQHVGMARGLYATESVFRQNLDACCKKLQPLLGMDLLELLHAPEERAAEATERLQQTAFAQPALFAIEYALARQWMALGVKPQALIGHSLGEYVAACIAGVLSLDDALALVAARGKLMQSLPGGTMLSVALPEQQVLPLLGERLSLAAVNAPSLCVVSGPTDAIEALEARLAPMGVEHRRLRTSHAFHSAMMDPILAPFTERVKQVRLSAPKIPFISNLTGTWITAEQATDPRYWTEHLRRAVRFGEGVTTLLASKEALLLEVGPGQALGMLVRQAGPAALGRSVLSTLPRAKDEQTDNAAFLETLGRLWLAGVQVDWTKLHASERRQRLPLPTYPFQRQRYFIEQRRMQGGAWAEPTHERGQEDAQVQPAAPAAKTSNRHQRPDLANAYEAARGDTERAVATLWEEMLGIEGIGIHDNFFELGGHSLLATQIASRLRTLFQADVPLRELLEHPTVAGLAAKVDAARGTAQARPADVMARISREGALPVSFAQQRLWFLDQLEPGSPLYNIPSAMQLEGALDVAALARAMAELVHRHESLRTTFVSRNGEPGATLVPSLELSLEQVDLSALPEAERGAETRRQIQQEALRPFDLSRGPLLRAKLLRLAEREHVLVLVMHHIVSDGWSLGVLVQEVAALYEAFSQGKPSPLPELAVQYLDFAAWQREHLQGPALERQLAWWCQQLEGVPHILELPTDKPRPPAQSYRGSHVTHLMPRELAEAIRTLGQKEGATTFMVLLAAFQALLHRYSGQEDFAVGSPIAGRTRPESEGLIGLFVNTLVLRARPAAHLSFRELLAQVRESTLGAFAHQDLPSDKLVEALRPERDLSRPPLFQVLFAVQNTPMPELHTPGLVLRNLEVANQTCQFDLHLEVYETSQGLSLLLMYNTDLYEQETVKRLLGHLRTLLEEAIARPEQRLAELPLLTAQERQQLLVEWNDNRIPFASREATLPGLFRAQVERSPDAEALYFEGHSVTYRELGRRTRALAHQLRRLGVGPEQRVGICMERSLEMPLALMAILEAGGAYVPLDPRLPPERLAFIVENSGVCAVVVQPHLTPTWTSVPVVSLPAGWTPPNETLEPLPLTITPASLAYVIYTSGSTGQPKGVLMTHRGVTNYLAWMEHNHGIGVGDAVLQFTSFSFDVSVWEFFGALSAGARLVIPAPGEHQDARRLAQIMREQRITHLETVPTMLEALLEQPDFLASTHLKHVFSGGEVLPWQTAARFYARMNGTTLHNCYGPTETTVDTLHWKCLKDAPERALPIGRPLNNQRAYVLDRLWQPVPVGVPGELFIAGVALARGYLGQPSLSAERFLPDAFQPDVPGARMYATGDRVRWRPEGVLEFIDRLDTQVKLRGLRIELGEIESVLRQQPGVREAAVVVREDAPGHKRLVAYLVPATGVAAPSVETLREALSGRLPEYMVPSAFVALEALPLNANGKVDRKALPAPEPLADEREHVAPRTPVEEKLAAIWSEVLHVEPVGIHDDFFELGGHSLLATQVSSRIAAQFGVELPLRELFLAPTLADLAERLELALRSGRRALPPPLRALPRGEEPPLSFAQQRLWFLDQLEPGSPLYNIAMAVRMEGTVDVPTLERSLVELLRRHEALRTVFPAKGGQPMQVITRAPAMPLRRVELKHLPEAGRMDEARRLALEEAQRPFDMGQGPMLRATLLALGEREHVLLLTMHHIVSDDWSMAVLIQEAAVIYEAFLAGRPSPLPEPAVQYVDFAAWQRGWLQGEVLEQQLAWWREQLQGAPRSLDLPTDRPRPAVQTSRGAHQTVVMPRALMEAVQALSQREGATPYMVLLSAYQTLLHRLSGQLDLSVGSPIAGRNHAEVERLVGCFVNTLVLRTRLKPEQTFRELLGQVREVVLEGLAHQDVPFERLVEELRPERDPSRSPLFQVMFVLQNVPMAELALPGLAMSPLEGTFAPTAKFDLTLTFTETPRGLHTLLEYNTDLFDHGTATRILQQMRTLLEGIVARPEQQLRHLPLLTEADRRQLLVDWNATRVDYPRDASIPALFEAQAERTPDAIAIEYQGQTLTYRELNKRANQLAHHLRAFGVGPESRVGLCLERSLELVVGILGILKTGGAYVPLDPSYPADRLSFMLQDTGVMVIVTQEKLADELPAQGALFVCLDADWDQVEVQPEDNVASGITAENVAYVMYTSGSTGRPKGVCVPHRAVVRLVKGSTFIDMGPQEVFLQLAPISFDASTLELWGSLLHGAKLVVYPAGTPSLDELGATLANSGISTLWLTAALFEQMQATQSQSLRSVRQLLAGGDVLPVVRVKERLAQGGIVVNGYGPTENTTFTCCYPMREVSQVGHSVSIGKPIASTQVYLLDASLQPVPVGVVGELYTGGDGLAVGYLNQPELTAEKFVPHPFSAEPGARLYRTGDLARYLPDGRIEFFGRRDAQVKVRGFRIELGEIETVLTQHAQVREAVVVVREDVPGDKRLVAYVTAKDDAPDTTALRAWMKERLPEYMVPPAYVVLEILPLSPNGKVDRKALPAPDGARSDEATFEPPRTDTEVKLADIWRSLLGVERVGLNDDFFELGGHSLLATQVVVRIREAFQTELALRELFDTPTLAGLSTRIDVSRGTSPMSQTPALQRVSREGHLPLSFAQQRMWFLEQLQPGSAFYNIPVTVRMEGQLDVPALERSFEELVQRHESLRTVFREEQGQPVQVIAPEARLPLTVVDLRELPAGEREAEVRRQVEAEVRRPFDLKTGPLLRPLLLRQDEQLHVLMLTMHHVVSDGWSMGVLVREMAALYEAHVQGKASPLPELPVQYADYAAWQRDWLQGEVLTQQLDHWRQQLTGAPQALALPTDKPRPTVMTSNGASLTAQLPFELSKALEALGHDAGATPFMVLLAAFQVLLSRYSGQDDISVGSPIAGRARSEVEGLIGFFVNTLVLRSRISPQQSFRELLAQVKETTLGAYAHQDVPFEKLVEELKPERDQSRSPLFQVMFGLQNAPLPELKLPGLKLQAIEPESQTSKFDLTLSAGETPAGFSLWLEYNTDLYEASTARRMLEQLQVLLEGIVAAPDRKLRELPLLSGTERQRVLADWNQTHTDFPRQHSIHQLFEDRARLHPEAIALEFGDTQLSYRELDTRANQLAHVLASKGVRSGDLVGICVERSADLVVGLLGILKAGAAYVPLDPSYPQQRLTFMLEDTQARVVVAQRHLVPSLPLGERSVVRLDEDLHLIRQQPTQPLSLSIDSMQAAYVIYTSGSTGKPKGVCVPHQAVVRLVRNTSFIELKEADRVGQASNASFDAATFELWGALLNGARVVGVPKDIALEAKALGEHLERTRINVLFVTTALFNQVARERPQSFSVLRQLHFGGEASDPKWVREVLQKGAPGKLLHVYGPTESTTFATWYLVQQAPEGSTTIPIGGALSNTTLYVLDRHGQPVPVGVPGELYIGGEGLAWGYLHRPELTAEKFVPNPFSTQPGERLYRTGDVVRWLPEGSLEFVGRVDAQVKVRGFRIELGEVESTLVGHPGVGEAVVMVREDTPGDKRLVGYVVAREGQGLEVAELKGYLKDKLPDYMVPAALVKLDKLPLNPNGKVDRKALPVPDQAQSSQEYVAPRNDTERMLTELWAEILGVPRVGIHDNFFDLGGHSLLATQALSRIRSTFQVELPLRDFFGEPTVANIAVKILNEQASQVDTAELERMMAELEQLSGEEAEALLSNAQPDDSNKKVS